MAGRGDRQPIEIHAERCTGCLTCELRCSLRFEKAFNPSKAKIRIRRLVDADTEYAIAFDDSCDRCGICAQHCPYGTLIQPERRGN